MKKTVIQIITLITSLVLLSLNIINVSSHENHGSSYILEGGGSYVKVVSDIGLNIRDKNCNWKGVLRNNQILYATGPESGLTNLSITTCTLGGQDYVMQQVSNNFISGYVAIKYIKSVAIHSESSEDGQLEEIEFFVDSYNGLNVRDQNCKKIGSITNKSIVSKRLKVSGSNYSGKLYTFETNKEMLCRLGSNTYPMIEYYIPSLDVLGYVATEYIN